MLEIKNVTKVFNLTGNKEDTRVALDNVSLTIKDGDFVTIIGGNGSGKSTLMNIITGVLTQKMAKYFLTIKISLISPSISAPHILEEYSKIQCLVPLEICPLLKI